MPTDKIKSLAKPKYSASRKAHRKTVLTLFGTRPEVIKLAPVIQRLEQRRDEIRTFNVASGQHKDLLYPFIDMFGIRVDEDLRLMTSNQDPSELCDRIFAALDTVAERELPDLIIVQGDTTTALAGALLGRHRGIRVAHVEAGLRSGNLLSPYPEEMNRRFITHLATFHFAATPKNRETLLSEGVSDNSIFVTGNPVVDALQMVRDGDEGLSAAKLHRKIGNRKCIVLTTHRRESFGEAIQANLKVLTKFVDEHEDLVLVFPIHPNPNVQVPAKKICGGHPRIIITEPMDYRNFIQVLSQSWLIVSDSGGVQEEVPSLGKPLLILRENTERSECIDSGMAKLVGGRPETLMAMLEEAYREDSWVNHVSNVRNPFGSGDSGEQIVGHVTELLDEAPFATAKLKAKKVGR
jgi:UDP-N-acetylglucosamine 2-epimerase (non-hydrolysing)